MSSCCTLMWELQILPNCKLLKQHLYICRTHKGRATQHARKSITYCTSLSGFLTVQHMASNCMSFDESSNILQQRNLSEHQVADRWHPGTQFWPRSSACNAISTCFSQAFACCHHMSCSSIAQVGQVGLQNTCNLQSSSIFGLFGWECALHSPISDRALQRGKQQHCKRSAMCYKAFSLNTQ